MKRCIVIFCLLAICLTSCNSVSYVEQLSTTESNIKSTTEAADTLPPTSDETTFSDDTDMTDIIVLPENGILGNPIPQIDIPSIDKEPYTAWVYAWTLTEQPDFSQYYLDSSFVEPYVHFRFEEMAEYISLPETITYKLDGKEFLCRYNYTAFADNIHFRNAPYTVYGWKKADNEGSMGTLFFDLETGRLIGIRRRVDAKLDEGKTKILSESECKQIALDFIAENVLAYEPYIDLNDYQLKESGLLCTSKGLEYEQLKYFYTFRRYVDGCHTNDYITVGVSLYGTIAEFQRGENCFDLEEWIATNNVDYLKAENAVRDVLRNLYSSDYENYGELTGHYFKKLYNGIYGLIFSYVKKNGNGIVLFVPLAKASSDGKVILGG